MKVEAKTHSFHGSNAIQPIFYILMSAIRALDEYGGLDNFQLLDAANNVVKSGKISELYVTLSGDKCYLEIRVDDTSTESYTFSKIRIFGYGIKPPTYDGTGLTLEWDTVPTVMIEHTFAQQYTKQSTQALHITLYHGIQGLI